MFPGDINIHTYIDYLVFFMFLFRPNLEVEIKYLRIVSGTAYTKTSKTRATEPIKPDFQNNFLQVALFINSVILEGKYSFSVAR